MTELLLPPSEVLNFGPTAAGVALVSGRGLLKGWGARETTAGGVTRFVIRDGVAAGAPLIVPITLSADQSTRDFIDGRGIEFTSGLFIDVLAGTVEGGLYVVLEEAVMGGGARQRWWQNEPGTYLPDMFQES